MLPLLLQLQGQQAMSVLSLCCPCCCSYKGNRQCRFCRCVTPVAAAEAQQVISLLSLCCPCCCSYKGNRQCRFCRCVAPVAAATRATGNVGSVAVLPLLLQL